MTDVINIELGDPDEIAQLDPQTAPDKSRAYGSYILYVLAVTVATWALGLLDLQHRTVHSITLSDGFPGIAENWKIRGEEKNTAITNNHITVNRQIDAQSYILRLVDLPENWQQMETTANSNAENSTSVDPQDNSIQKTTDGVLDFDSFGKAIKKIERKTIELLRPSNQQPLLRVWANTQTVRASLHNVEKPASLMIWFLEDPEGKPVLFNSVKKYNEMAEDEPSQVESILEIPSQSKAFYIALQNRDGDGEYRVSDVKLDLVNTTAYFWLVVSFLGLLWTIMVIIGLVWFVKHSHPAASVAICLFIGAIILGVLLPESINQGILSDLTTGVQRLMGEKFSIGQSLLFKIGHLVLFFLLTITLFLSNVTRFLSTKSLVTLIVLFAIASEGLQLHLFDRTTRLTDFFIDLVGVVLAIFLCLLIQSVLRKNKPSSIVDVT